MPLASVLGKPVFTRAELVAAGLSRRTISRRVAAKLFVPVGPGLLCLAGRAKEPLIVDTALCMRDGYHLTGPSAAAFYPSGPITEGPARKKPWLVGRPLRGVDAVFLSHPTPEVVERHGLSVASPRQAAMDCIRGLPWAEVEDHVFRWVQQKLLTVEDLAAEVDRLSGYRHVGRLRVAADAVRSNAHSRSENVFHKLLRQEGLLGWVANMEVTVPYGGVVIDIAFPELKIAIEYDSPGTHSSPSRFRADRKKWNALKKQGWVVLNYTWEDITQNWAETFGEILFFVSLARQSAG